jgi:hypothetical protein
MVVRIDDGAASADDAPRVIAGEQISVEPAS